MFETYDVTMNSMRKKIKEKAGEGKAPRTINVKEQHVIMASIANTPDFKSTRYKVRSGEVTEVESYPSNDMRAFLSNVVSKFGVDKNEAVDKMKSIKFKPSDLAWAKTITDESMVSQLELGKKVSFNYRPDLIGDIYMKNEEPTVSLHRIPNSEDMAKVSKKRRKTLHTITTTPKHMKTVERVKK